MNSYLKQLLRFKYLQKYRSDHCRRESLNVKWLITFLTNRVFHNINPTFKCNRMQLLSIWYNTNITYELLRCERILFSMKIDE